MGAGTMTHTPDAILTGYEFVESDGSPVITLDNQRRFYLNATTRRLLGIKPYDRLAIAYNVAEKSLAVVKPGASVSDAHIELSRYHVDKRYYLSARHFSRTYSYHAEGAPYHFDYERGSSDGSVFIFRLSSE